MPFHKFTLDHRPAEINAIRQEDVGAEAEAQHNDRHLAAVGLTAAAYLQLLKRLLLLCASLDPVIGLIGFCILISEFSQDFAGFCWDACGSGPASHPSALLPKAIFLGGWVLFPLIACITGCLHALTIRQWKWIVCVLGPLSLLETLFFWLVLNFFPGEHPHLPLKVPSGLLAVGAVLTPLLVSLFCLVYAFRVEE
jgi:hypothetical protein